MSGASKSCGCCLWELGERRDSGGDKRCGSCLQMLGVKEAVSWRWEKIDSSRTPNCIIRIRGGAKGDAFSYKHNNKSKYSFVSFFFFYNKGYLPIVCLILATSSEKAAMNSLTHIKSRFSLQLSCSINLFISCK